MGSVPIFSRDMFYTTDISVALWLLNKNKKARIAKLNGVTKNYRNRSGEILFVDLRRWGSEYEKMFILLSSEDIGKVALNLHNWSKELTEEFGKGFDEREIRKIVTL